MKFDNLTKVLKADNIQKSDDAVQFNVRNNPTFIDTISIIKKKNGKYNVELWTTALSAYPTLNSSYEDLDTEDVHNVIAGKLDVLIGK